MAMQLPFCEQLSSRAIHCTYLASNSPWYFLNLIIFVFPGHTKWWLSIIVSCMNKWITLSSRKKKLLIFLCYFLQLFSFHAIYFFCLLLLLLILIQEIFSHENQIYLYVKILQLFSILFHVCVWFLFYRNSSLHLNFSSGYISRNEITVIPQFSAFDPFCKISFQKDNTKLYYHVKFERLPNSPLSCQYWKVLWCLIFADYISIKKSIICHCKLDLFHLY